MAVEKVVVGNVFDVGERDRYHPITIIYWVDQYGEGEEGSVAEQARRYQPWPLLYYWSSEEKKLGDIFVKQWVISWVPIDFIGIVCRKVKWILTSWEWAEQALEEWLNHIYERQKFKSILRGWSSYETWNVGDTIRWTSENCRIVLIGDGKSWRENNVDVVRMSDIVEESSLVVSQYALYPFPNPAHSALVLTFRKKPEQLPQWERRYLKKIAA